LALFALGSSCSFAVGGIGIFSGFGFARGLLGAGVWAVFSFWSTKVVVLGVLGIGHWDFMSMAILFQR
jgi:hypothetical protein